MEHPESGAELQVAPASSWAAGAASWSFTASMSRPIRWPWPPAKMPAPAVLRHPIGERARASAGGGGWLWERCASSPQPVARFSHDWSPCSP